MSLLLDLPLRVVMLCFIFVFSLVGVRVPFFLDKRASTDILNSTLFDLIQCFAVGIICGVAILHIFADAQEDLSEVSELPVAGTIMLLGCFAMVALNRMISLVAARNTSSRDVALNSHNSHDEVVAHNIYCAEGIAPSIAPPGTHDRRMSESCSGSFHGHVHQRLLLEPGANSSAGTRIKAYLLECAIAVHSILVGLGVGVIDEHSSEKAALKVISLGIALCFHQLFEGIAVGSQGVRVGLRGQGGIFMVVLFSISCPLGGLLGIAIEANLDTDSSQAHWIIGSLNAFAAGTLIEIGCVDLLPELFSHKHGHEEKISLRAESLRLLALVFGSAVMAVLAIWA